METAIALFLAALALLLFLATLLELFSVQKRRKEALYLVSRVGDKHGYAWRESPLSLVVPQQGADAVVHYHLLSPGEERDSITLKDEHRGETRLGSVLIDNQPSRLFVPGMKRVVLGRPELDRYFRIFARPENLERVRSRVARDPELCGLLKALSSRTAGGHFELDDFAGMLKIQFDDLTLRFPSDVEEITLDLIRFHRLYRALT